MPRTNSRRRRAQRSHTADTTTSLLDNLRRAFIAWGPVVLVLIAGVSAWDDLKAQLRDYGDRITSLERRTPTTDQVKEIAVWRYRINRDLCELRGGAPRDCERE